MNTSRTIIERFAFNDPDRATPLHDEIQIWVSNNINTVVKSFTAAENQIEVVSITLERPISKLNSPLVGFIDVYATGKIISSDGYSKPFFISFEVKGRIHSCGDLIRQINFYRKHEAYPTVWVVVSPDDKFKNTLLSQGIYHYRYPKSQATLF